MSRQDGFTIVEMMMVLLIVGILVGIAIASYSFSLSRSRETVCRSNLRTIHEALSVYEAMNGHRPASLYDLVPEYIDPGCGFRCPDSHEEYLYDADTGRVSCPRHSDL